MWLLLYAALALAPAALVLLTADKPPRPFWTEFSVALGFVGLAMMALQFVLTARFKRLKAPYGSDVIYAFHKAISIIAILLVLAHPALLFATRWEAMLERPRTHPWPFFTGLASVACLVWLAVVSLFRKRLGIGYDAWRRAHAVLAVGAIGLAVAHILFVGHYLDSWLQRGLWLAYTLVWVGLIVHVRLVKPARELRRPWAVRRVIAERGGAFTLELEPRGHPGLRFQPGQFAWVTLFDSPFTDHEHPFSFSGSAEEPGVVRFTIKEVGDWTSRVRHAAPGTRAFVDGPFGALSIDRRPDAEGLALFAGGVGITPMMSHLRTLEDRRDPRPVTLFYAAKDWDSLTFREEIEAMRARNARLRVVYVLGSAPAGGAGGATVETGFLTRQVIERHAPELGKPGSPRTECFICGPPAMMAAVERALFAMGVPLGRFHSERFDLV